MADYPCPDCERSFTTKKGLAVHSGMMHKGDKDVETKVEVEGTAEDGEEGEEGFSYPQLGELPKMDEEAIPGVNVEGAAEGGDVGDEEADKEVAEAKPAPEPVRLELSKLWEMLGNFIDKDDPLSEKEIQALNDSLNSLGLATLPSDDPIVVPNWLPVVLTIVSVFGMRLLKKYGSEIMGNIKDKLLSKGSMVKKEEEE